MKPKERTRPTQLQFTQEIALVHGCELQVPRFSGSLGKEDLLGLMTLEAEGYWCKWFSRVVLSGKTLKNSKGWDGAGDRAKPLWLQPDPTMRSREWMALQRMPILEQWSLLSFCTLLSIHFGLWAVSGKRHNFLNIWSKAGQEKGTTVSC